MNDLIVKDKEFRDSDGKKSKLEDEIISLEFGLMSLLKYQFSFSDKKRFLKEKITELHDLNGDIDEVLDEFIEKINELSNYVEKIKDYRQEEIENDIHNLKSIQEYLDKK